MLQTIGRSVLETRAWTSDDNVFAILDATDTPSVPELVHALPADRFACLYREPAASQYAGIAPYLVQLDAPLFDWIAASLWSEPWGILLQADCGFPALYTHLRKFLTVQGPAGEEWLFRYYDPRVLPTYLATCTPDERARFFGPVSRFAVTDPDSYAVLELAQQGAVAMRA